MLKKYLSQICFSLVSFYRKTLNLWKILGFSKFCDHFWKILGLVNFVTIFENYVMNFLLYLELKNISIMSNILKNQHSVKKQPWKHLAGKYNFIQWKIYIVISFFLKVPFDCFLRLSNSTVTLKFILNQRACVCCCKKCQNNILTYIFLVYTRKERAVRVGTKMR